MYNAHENINWAVPTTIITLQAISVIQLNAQVNKTMYHSKQSLYPGLVHAIYDIDNELKVSFVIQHSYFLWVDIIVMDTSRSVHKYDKMQMKWPLNDKSSLVSLWLSYFS